MQVSDKNWSQKLSLVALVNLYMMDEAIGCAAVYGCIPHQRSQGKSICNLICNRLNWVSQHTTRAYVPHRAAQRCLKYILIVPTTGTLYAIIVQHIASLMCGKWKGTDNDTIDSVKCVSKLSFLCTSHIRKAEEEIFVAPSHPKKKGLKDKHTSDEKEEEHYEAI